MSGWWIGLAIAAILGLAVMCRVFAFIRRFDQPYYDHQPADE